MLTRQSKKSNLNTDFFLEVELPGGKSKQEVLQDVSQIVERKLGILHQEVEASLLGREQDGDTAIIDGIAIPHIIVTSSECRALIVKLEKPITDWKDLNGKPITLLICPITDNFLSKNVSGSYLIKKLFVSLADDKLLASISKAESASVVKQKLIQALEKE